MDIRSKWTQIIQASPARVGGAPVIDIGEVVDRLNARHLQLWWASVPDLPDFQTTYTSQEQAAAEKKMARLVDGLIYETKRLASASDDYQEAQARLRAGALDFARDALNLEQRHVNFLETSGIIEAVQAFARQARQYDPRISGDDIYQAARNVMSMNFIQLLLGVPVEVTPSAFAYSMLYPYTDNYLDDPAIPRSTKLAFNHRFKRRLEGDAVRPANQHEEMISDLVGMIEGEWERARYPQVYDSLLAIHAAQARSLRLVNPGSGPYEQDVLGISFEKGGTSVLADGYLIAGWLTPEQAELLYGYGAFTQLMDDLEDVESDQREGRMSIFSQLASRWPLDRVTNQMFSFGRAVFRGVDCFTSPSAGPLKELIARSVEPVLIDTVGRSGKYYSKAYLREIERHLPFRFGPLRRQRSRLERQKVTLSRLVETFFL